MTKSGFGKGHQYFIKFLVYNFSYYETITQNDGDSSHMAVDSMEKISEINNKGRTSGMYIIGRIFLLNSLVKRNNVEQIHELTSKRKDQ